MPSSARHARHVALQARSRDRGDVVEFRGHARGAGIGGGSPRRCHLGRGRGHRPQAHRKPAGRTGQHRRLYEQGPSESRHLAIRRLREPHSVHFVRERRSRYADVRDARRIRRQQPELRQHRLHRLPARRHVDELLRHHARPSSVRHCANRSAQRSAGDDVRRRRHGRRVAFHHQQARPQGVQRRHRRRRRQGRVRQPQRHGGGVHQHPPHRRLDGAAYFRVQRLPRRIHQQSEHHPQLGERHGVEQFAVVGEELQRGEGDGRPDRPRSSHCGRLESLVDLQLPARTHARRVGPGSDHRRRGRCRRQPGQRPGTLSRFPQRGSLWPGIQAVLHEDLGFPSGGRRGHR